MSLPDWQRQFDLHTVYIAKDKVLMSTLVSYPPYNTINNELKA